MNIQIDTKYNIGDEVYIIQLMDKYNDYYSNEQIFRIRGFFDNKDPKYIIKEISVTKNYSIHNLIEYQIDKIIYHENDIFKTLDAAKEECERRNKEYGYK